MFGLYRTLLALMVVAQHLGGIPTVGAYAVFGFYSLSGYLMTFIMQRNYGYTPQGVVKYAINRILRIYPIYWVSIALMAIIIYIVGEKASLAYHHALHLPHNFSEFFHNILLYFPFGYSPRLTPPSWALTVEIFFYILIGMGISKNKNIVIAWFLISIFYHIFILLTDGNWADRYFAIWAASLPFSTGALIYHFKAKLLNYIPAFASKNIRLVPIVIFGSILINCLAGYLTGLSEMLFFYTNLLLCSIMVLVLADQKSLPFITRKFDKKAGDLSYPIYLVHYQAGLIVITTLGTAGMSLQRHDMILLAASLPVIFILSWVFTKAVEQPIELIRARVKTKNSISTRRINQN